MGLTSDEGPFPASEYGGPYLTESRGKLRKHANLSFHKFSKVVIQYV